MNFFTAISLFVVSVLSSAITRSAPAAVSPAAPATTAAAPLKKTESGWVSLFDGKSLRGWTVTDFAGHGETRVERGQIVIGAGDELSGIQRTNPTPRIDYEVEAQAMKLDGDDFFCGLTFPVGATNCTLIVGGWGGGVVGISSIDGMDASQNETTRYQAFAKNKWCDIRLRVTKNKIQAWIDGKQLIDVSITGKRLGMRAGEIELSGPFGLATYQTTAAYRLIRLRKLTPQVRGTKRR